MTPTGRRVPVRGELWTVAIPDDPHVPRPCLVVSDNTINTQGHVLAVPIWTSAPSGPTRIPLRQGTGGISHDSVLMCDYVTRVPAARLHSGPLGSLVPIDVRKAVVRAIRIAIGDPTVGQG